MKISNLIDTGRLKRLLLQYADVFHVTVILTGSSGEVLLRCPEDVPDRGDAIVRPLTLRGSVIGHIAVPLSDGVSERHLAFMEENLLCALDMGYEIESLSEEVARNYEELSLLWRLSARLGADLDVDRVCNILADEVMTICPSRNVLIMLPEEVFHNIPDVPMAACPGGPAPMQSPKEALLRPRVALGADVDKAPRITLRTGSGLTAYVFEKKEPLTVCNVYLDTRFEVFPYPVRNILIVPLIVEDGAIGAIVATDKFGGEEFFSMEIKMISSIASECAISIKKALLFGEIHKTLFSTVEAFSVAIDAKDPYTYGHSKRVSEIAVDIAERMGLPPESVNWIRLAALLHDIGKIGTPEVILHKVGKLTPGEMEKIKEHPRIGARMLENIPRLKNIAAWINDHHEQYDGAGYPSGKKGDDIPLPARIIAIADNFDALTSDRSYRNAYSLEEAVDIMKHDVGVRFDPAVFDYFRLSDPAV